VAETYEVHVPKGYAYFAMAFSLVVESINIRMRTAQAKQQQQTETLKLRKDIPGE
jgi:predicted tellurium resistance membrane protein TerC